MLLLVIGATNLMPAAMAQGTGIVWDAVLDCNAPGEGTLRPRIDLNAANDPVVLWGRTGPAANYVSIGTESGFTPRLEVSMEGCVPSVDDWLGSSIAVVGDVVWVVMKATPEISRPIYVRRSDDGGYTWGDTIRVDPFDGLVSRFPSIAVEDPESPVVQYMQFDGGWSGARQVVTHMMGDTFQPPVQVSSPFAPGHVCDCCPNQVITDGDRVVALYRNEGSNIREIWGAASGDHGMTFPVGGIVDTTGWILNACPSSGPDGYMVGDSIRYVWMSGANNGTKVYLGSALASDLSLGRQLFVSPGQPIAQQQNFPRIAGRGDTLGVVWEQIASGARDIYFSWSTTGVNGLSTPQMVNVEMAGSQRSPDIAYTDGSFHIIWSEVATNQVRYRKATIQEGVGISEVIGDPVKFWLDPVSNIIHVSDGPWTNAEVFDMQGRRVKVGAMQQTGVQVATLRTGQYILRVFGPNGRAAEWRFVKH